MSFTYQKSEKTTYLDNLVFSAFSILWGTVKKSGLKSDLRHTLPGECVGRVPTVREKSVKNEKSSRSGKSQGILSWVREIWTFGKSQGKVREFYNNNLLYFLKLIIKLFNQVDQCVQILGVQKYDIEHLSDMKYNAVLSMKL